MRDGTVKLGGNFARAEAAFATLGERLLFGSAAPSARPESRTGTTSLPARQAFSQGQAAVYSWDLVRADSAFAAATRYDPQYAQAFLWLAQTRSWNGAPTATWQSAAERAAAERARLSSRDQVLSDALLAFGRGQIERACSAWTRLTDFDQYDFAAWYGLANCLSRDDAVQRDSTSPSGWRFRTSYEQSTRAYERAFQLVPSILRAQRGSSYESLRRLLKTSTNALRFGRGLSSGAADFAAYPLWQGDTLAFVPYPTKEILSAAYPRSADAMEALAIALELLGDPSALDTLRRARAVASSPGERVRAAGSEVWMRVKFSVPSDLVGLQSARALADSQLRSYALAEAPEPEVLASLAALTGRAQLAAALKRPTEVPAGWEGPPELEWMAVRLLTFAALGGPVDSLRVLERTVGTTIDRTIVMPARRRARLQWLARPATLAFPEYRFQSLPGLVGTGDYLVDAQMAFARGDTAFVRSLYAELRAARRHLPPGDLTIDALYPEAWLLAALGDDRAAIAWLDPTLVSLLSTPPELLVEPANAAALVRAMALRADLADRMGERGTAARWAAVVVALWSDADPFLQPLVRRMRRLAG